MQPRYEHDCDTCVFIGQIREFDLYICKSTIVARCSSDGADYMSGQGFHINNLRLSLNHVECDKCGTKHYGTCPNCKERTGYWKGKELINADATEPWRQ